MWYLEGNDLLNQIVNTKLSADEMAFWYIGQCGFVFKREKVIYIDPVLNDIKIKPDLIIPMHYDMIKENTANPLRLLEKLRDANWNKKSMVPLLGERVVYKKGEER